MRMLVLGGDKRAYHLAVLAANQGVEVQTLALGVMPQGHGRLSAIAHPSEMMPVDVVVLPFPQAEKEAMLPAPLAAPQPLSAIIQRIPRGQRIVAGNLGPLLQEASAANDWRVHNPIAEEAFTIENAVPSAEGVIAAAMMRSEGCLTGSHCLVVGFGRIAKVLCDMLHGLHARVTVAARKEADLCYARAFGYAVCPIAELGKGAMSTDFVFNTAPAMLINRPVLEALPRHALVVDLASAPFGVDLQVAASLGITAWRESAIPGRYAPKTAAQILLRYITKLSQE